MGWLNFIHYYFYYLLVSFFVCVCFFFVFFFPCNSTVVVKKERKRRKKEKKREEKNGKKGKVCISITAEYFFPCCPVLPALAPQTKFFFPDVFYFFPVISLSSNSSKQNKQKKVREEITGTKLNL